MTHAANKSRTNAAASRFSLILSRRSRTLLAHPGAPACHSFARCGPHTHTRLELALFVTTSASALLVSHTRVRVACFARQGTCTHHTRADALAIRVLWIKLDAGFPQGHSPTPWGVKRDFQMPGLIRLTIANRKNDLHIESSVPELCPNCARTLPNRVLPLRNAEGWTAFVSWALGCGRLEMVAGLAGLILLTDRNPQTFVNIPEAKASLTL